MSNISLDLSNKLPADQVNIIRQVVHAATSEGLGLFIVGAQARDLLIQHVYKLPVHRATNDIDLVMAMVRNRENYHGDYDLAMAMLTELRTGISEA